AARAAVVRPRLRLEPDRPLGSPGQAREPRRRRWDRARGARRLIEPALADDAFIADVERAPAGALHLWWLGQSGFLVKCDGRHLLLDPYLSDSLTEKYAGTATPHVRMSRRLVDPARLRFVDVVASSHSHTDHLDPVTLKALAPRALVCPAAARKLAQERAGVEPLPVEEGETVVVAGFALTAVRAEHDAPGGALGYLVRCG